MIICSWISVMMKLKKIKLIIKIIIKKFLVLGRFFMDKRPKKKFSYSETKNIKHYQIKKSCDSIRNRSRKNTVSKTLVNGKK